MSKGPRLPAYPIGRRSDWHFFSLNKSIREPQRDKNQPFTKYYSFWNGYKQKTIFSYICIMKSVAEKKKSQNIAEYIVYMYQMEDLIRSYQGNMDEIKQYVITHYPVTEEVKTEVGNWFENLTQKLKAEEKMDSGHLTELNALVKELSEIHWDLLKRDKTYFDTYQNVKPHVLQAVMDADGKDLGNEIQICLNGVYGLLLCRLLGKKVSDEQLKSAEAFGDVLSYLSRYYHTIHSLPEN